MIKKTTIFFLAFYLCLVCCIQTNFAWAKSTPKVRLSKKRVTLEVKQTYKIKLKKAKSKKVRWSSSNKKVATVKRGLITGKKKGKCKIIAKYKKKKYKCTVLVSESQSDDATVSEEGSTQYYDICTNGKLSMEVVSFSKDTNVVAYTITSNSEATESLTSFFFLEKSSGKGWETVPRIETSVVADAILISPYETLQFEKDLDNYYASLSSGNYRICVQTNYGVIFSEFSI